MKRTIGGKRYNTSTCEILGEKDLYSHSNNYTGTRYLLRAKNGVLLVWQDTNGQDIHYSDFLELFEDLEYTIDDFNLDEDQEKRCAELQLIEIV